MMPSESAVIEIGIVVYPGAQTASVHGLTDLFEIAGRLATTGSSGGRTTVRITHWQPSRTPDAEISCIYDSDPRGTPQPRILVIPPTLVDLPDHAIIASIALWLCNRHATGAKLVSVCSGAFLLAETGLVTGRSISTHHSCAGALAERFPDIVVDPDRRIIEDGDFLSAGGFMAWVDVGLILVERTFGAAVRTETAHFVLSDPTVRAAPYFVGFAANKAHGDAAVLKAQELVHIKDGRDVSLAAMAAAARLERRTLLRRFAKATGMTPVEYCRSVRMARARELLEFGHSPLKEIAESLGYRDVATFARSFRKSVGQAPGAYRKQFGAALAVNSKLDVTIADDQTATFVPATTD